MDSLTDRAREWVNEHYPELDGSEYEAKLAEVRADLASIDSAADAAEMSPPSS